ncbi:M56 family metallopeptidase [Gramella sp. GC03-9]|uniref:M56 family metallopeptidase n=1 Tax=Christiangramia oceanisediminis TaxID=2920386 RepID=A0A9X2I6W4_9FLAO|nr:M56 family metallopeptidase [Gramella oceanisediminis]MCP9198774.1 M56 family metallopeptidase [Gramella oceanisediminis]
MIHYILQVLFFQLLFLLVYDLFLKKETFFNYNRLYLLVTPILAFAIPWLRLEFLVNAVPESAKLVIPQALNNDPNIYVQNLPLVVINAEGGWTPNWWLITYLGGTVFSLGLFIYKYLHLKKLSEAGSHTYENEFRIINVPDSRIAYTFFNSVYLGEDLSENEKKQILSHELIHVKQKHTYDLIFFEVLKILFWFNPLVYVYQSRIAGVHEFIADNEVVKTVAKKTYFEQLLNTAFNTKDISFTNQFFTQSLIKKRILMLQKNKSSKLSKFKFLLVIPLMLAMLTYVACSEDKSEDLSPIDNEASVADKIAELKTYLDNKDSLSKEEKEEFQQLIKRKEELLRNERYGKDGTPPPPPPAAPDNKWNDADKIPFAVIEKVPAFTGCEQYLDDVRKNCTSTAISNFVNKNFDTSLGKKLGLTGVNRVIVQFRIDETGKIQDVRARAPHPELEEEAKRVISSLPQMQPGEQNGQPISVMYSLPIAFKVSE